MNHPALWRRAALALSVVIPAVLSACGGGEDTPVSLSLEQIGAYEALKEGASEITAYDWVSKRVFVVNGANGTVDVLDLAEPTRPVKVATLDIKDIGDSVNSVAVHDGLVALAIQASPKTAAGKVAFYDSKSLQRLSSVTVGALPDMLTFTPDGRKVLVANEGEPNSYNQADSVDPEGSVSVITVNAGTAPTVATADFQAWNAKVDALRAAGVRIYGPNATVAQDLEPEYITVSPDGETAYVTLQENNAVAVVDVATAKVTAIHALGWKDHGVAGAGLDASDEDAGTNTNSGTPLIKIQPYRVRGLYLPDAIASYTVDGQTYLVTANEGDARADWPGFNEETRVRAWCSAGLDPAVFTDAALTFDSNLGRLRVTSAANGNLTGKNAAGQCSELYSFGARSISIWRPDAQAGTLVRVGDTGDEMEQRTKALPNVNFNAGHDNDTADSRSPNKGPEPEGVVVARFGARQFAFVVLERVGGVMVFDVTDPAKPAYTTYLNTRVAGTPPATGGPRGPEGIHFVPAHRSPNGRPLLIVGHEVSGTTSVVQVNLGY